MKPLQQHPLIHLKVMEKSIFLEISLSDQLKSHFKWWKNLEISPLKNNPISHTSVTDAYMGAHLGQMHVSGVWSRDLSLQHIN